jgi:hypothetical protein
MSQPELDKPHGLNWNAASMELPEMPMVSPGADAMSMTIAGVLPTLAAELTTSVVALSAKENMFSGKLTAAESAYQNADDQGQSSVGQLGQMLGQVGQMAQSAAGSAGGAGGGGGIFSSLMEQAMKAVQGASGSHDGGPADANEQGAGTQDGGAQGAGAPVAAGQAAPPQGSAGQQSAAHGATGQPPPQQHPDDREAREHVDRREPPPVGAAGPGEQRGAGPAPITQQEPSHRRGDDDIARRV